MIYDFTLQKGTPNGSTDDIEKPWKDKVDALEKVNEVLRQEINELQEEAQSTMLVLNQAKNKLKDCKANEMRAEEERNLKICDLKKELENLKFVKFKLEGAVKEMEIKYSEELKIGKARISEKKELEQKILEQQKKIHYLKVVEQTCKDKENIIVTLRERIQVYSDQHAKFLAHNQAYEETLKQNSELETKLSDKIKELEQSKKSAAALKGNITKIKKKNQESEEIIERIWDKIKDKGFL